jgi:cellobiose phosphorylase
MYPYLTGSASWYLLCLLTEALGVKGRRGDLALEPKLVREQFGLDGRASVSTLFADRRLQITYHNQAHLEYDEYAIQEIRIDGEAVPFQGAGDQAILSRAVVTALPEGERHDLDVILGARTGD